MSLVLARLSQRVARVAPGSRRGMITDPKPPAHHVHLPFGYTNKRTFLAKLLTFSTIGLGVPVAAAQYQKHKSGAV